MKNKSILIIVLIGLSALCVVSCKKKMVATQNKVNVTAPTGKNEGPLIAIGESYAGGIIFYVDSTKKHGLVSPANQTLVAMWGCMGKVIGGTSAAIGTGQANTLAIINGCDSTKTAARICDDLVVNGYSDWYLPSKGELNLLFQSKASFRGIKTDYYWSSTEADGSSAECQDFYDGHKLPYEKNRTYFVRAIRAF